MITSLVKSVPEGDFADVSALVKGWQNRMQMLVSQKQRIKFDFYPLPSIPEEIQNTLTQHGYRDLVLESDQWQHFFVPISNWGNSKRKSTSEILEK